MNTKMKLTPVFKKINTSIQEIENWDEYKSRLNLESDLENPINYFLFHVISEHYTDFTNRFRGFELDNFLFEFKNYSAAFIDSKVNFDDPDIFNIWIEVVKKGKMRLPLYNFMKENLTFPCPIVIFEFENFNVSGLILNRFKLTPFHLIEGTHRVAYLKFLYKNEIIQKESQHKVLVLRQKK